MYNETYIFIIENEYKINIIYKNQNRKKNN